MLSFVFGLLCFIPTPTIILFGLAAIPLGIVGITKTRGGRGRGLWMAITGLALVVAGALFTVLVLYTASNAGVVRYDS